MIEDGSVIRQLRDLSRDTIGALTRCEFAADRPTARRIDNEIERAVDAWSSKSTCPKGEVPRSVWGLFRSFSGAAKRLLPGFARAVVVYFQPGSADPLPLYFKGHDVSARHAAWARYMHRQTEHVSSLLKRGSMVDPDKPQRHLFNLSYLHAKTWALTESISSPGTELDEQLVAAYQRSQAGGHYSLGRALDRHGVCYSGPSICVDVDRLARKPRMDRFRLYVGDNRGVWLPHDAAFLMECNSGEYILISPIFLNDDTFALLSTYLAKRSCGNLTEEQLEAVLERHCLLARTVFAPLYATLLRGGLADLRRSLERSSLSASLLEMATGHLGPPPRATGSQLAAAAVSPAEMHYRLSFSVGDDDGVPRPIPHNTTKFEYPSYFRSAILGDITKRPDDVFKYVAMLQRRVYQGLRWDYARLTRKRGNSLPESIRTTLAAHRFPSDMPVAKDLDKIERSERALNLARRDHVAHQFQTFLLGALVMRACGDKMLARWTRALKKSLPHTGALKKGATRVRFAKATAPLLLKFAWLVCSCRHDVGYPASEVDRLTKELWKEIGRLVGLNDQHTAASVPRPLRVDQLLYDDPRTYLLLRKLAQSVGGAVVDQKGCRIPDEQWSYFLRYLAFECKDHSIIGALVVGHHLLRTAGSYKCNQMEDLIETTWYGRFVMRHIMTPIALHHAYEWAEKLGKLLCNYEAVGKEKEHDLSKGTHVKETLSRLQQTFGCYPASAVRGEEPPVPHFGSLGFASGVRRVSFDSSPMACLLALGDILQEEGRPSGKKEQAHPDYDASGSVFDKRLFRYSLWIQYSSKGARADKRRDLRKRKLKAQLFTRMFDTEWLFACEDPKVELTISHNRTGDVLDLRDGARR